MNINYYTADCKFDILLGRVEKVVICYKYSIFILG